MELDIAVAKLKLMRSSHNSVCYEMEDKVIKYYPTEIKKTQERIEGMSADLKVAQSKPVGEDNFCMTIKGKEYRDKKIVGEAILGVCKTFKKAENRVDLGEYRGFPMTLCFENGKFQVELKQAITHTVELENSITGNITRINNVIDNIPNKIIDLKEIVDRLKNEMESAKSESERKFPKEAEYKEKNKRLSELNKELDNESKSDKEIGEPQEKKTMKPSVLHALNDKIKNPIEDRKSVEKPLIKQNIR